MKTFDDFHIDLRGCTGEEVATTCPQCSASRKNKLAKCLSVNTVKSVWCCHHCHWRGSLKSGEESRSKPPKRIVKPSFEKPSVVPPLVHDWFAKRGIPEEVVARHCIALKTVYMPQLEEEVPCWAFPYTRHGETVNIKFRALQEKVFRQVKDAEKIVGGLDDLTESWAAAVEGECDKLALDVAGIRNTFTVPDGAPPVGSKSSETKFEYLVNCAAQLDKLTKIVLAVDNDPPGKTLEEELARRLGPERCWRVTWPDGCKDANEVLLKHGPERLRDVIETAKPYPIDGVIEAVDLVDDVLALYEQGLPGGLSTGYASIDRHYTVKVGELTIITGIPAHGKSEWLDWLMVRMAMLHDWCCAIHSPENFPVARHLAKLIQKHIGKPFSKGNQSRMTRAEIADSLQWAQDHFVFIGQEEAISIDHLLQTVKSLVTRRGIRGLVLDPWNEFDHRRPATLTETEYISECLGKLRRFARSHQLHIWLVAHPMKLRRREDETYPVPTPYDISGSAHWRNKADNCLCVWRDEQNPQDPVKLYVQKIRFREVGKVGVVDLQFDPVNGRYVEA